MGDLAEMIQYGGGSVRGLLYEKNKKKTKKAIERDVYAGGARPKAKPRVAASPLVGHQDRGYGLTARSAGLNRTTR